MKAFKKYASTWSTNSTSPSPSIITKGRNRTADDSLHFPIHIETQKDGSTDHALDVGGKDKGNDLVVDARGADVKRLSVSRASSDPIIEAPFVFVGPTKDIGADRASKNHDYDSKSVVSNGIANRRRSEPHSLVVPERVQSRRRSKQNSQQSIAKDELAAEKAEFASTSTPLVASHRSDEKYKEHLSPSPLETRSKSFPDSSSTVQSRETKSDSSDQKRKHLSISRAWKQRNSQKPTSPLWNSTEGESIGSEMMCEDPASPSHLLKSTAVPSISTGSQSLASKLNDLAVAHNEGLLGEEEYRMLRLVAFQNVAANGGMEMPREERFNTKSAPKSTLHSLEAHSSSSSPPQSMTSRRSSRSNIMSIFRKGSAASEARSIADEPTSTINSRYSKKSTLEAQVNKARRTRSIRSHASQSARVESMPSSGNSISMNSSYDHLRNSSGSMSASGHSASAFNTSSGNALLADTYRNRTTSEIEAEIAIIEAEGKRILDGFRMLQTSTIGKYRLDYTQIKEAMSGIDEQDFTSVNRHLGKEGNSRIDTSTGINRKKKEARKSKSSGNLDMLLSSNGRQGRRREISATSPPSSYRGLLGPTMSSQPNSPLGSISPNSMHNGISTEDCDADDISKLRMELVDINCRRNEVSKKYIDRLAFLQSTLRSAKIRQTLKR